MQLSSADCSNHTSYTEVREKAVREFILSSDRLQELYERLAHTVDVAYVKEALLGHDEALGTAFDSVYDDHDTAGQPVYGSRVLLLEKLRNIHTFVETHLTYFEDRDIKPFRVATSALEAAVSEGSDVDLWKQVDAVHLCLRDLCEWIRNKNDNLCTFLRVLRGIVEASHILDTDISEQIGSVYLMLMIY
jgi:hypothetical protein